MKLDEKDIDALAKARLKKHKNIQWNRKYTIPYYVGLVVAVVISLMSLSISSDMVMISPDGDKVLVVDSESMVVDGVEYTRDKGKEEKGFPDIFLYIILGFLALACVAYWKWIRDLKQPYIKSFKEYYREHGELME